MRRVMHALAIAGALAVSGVAQAAPAVPALHYPATTPGPIFEDDAGTVLHWTADEWNMVRFPETFTNAAWQLSGVPAPVATTSLGPSGSTAYRLTTTTSNTALYQAITLPAGTYTFSVYARTEGGTLSAQIIGIYAGSAQCPGARTITSDWQRFDCTATIAGGAASLTIFPGAGNTFLIADASLTRSAVALPYKRPSTSGDTLVMNGTLPFSTTSPLFPWGTGAGRRGVGPFTSSNYFSRTTPMVAGNTFTSCVAFSISANPATAEFLIGDTSPSGSGVVAYLQNGGNTAVVRSGNAGNYTYVSAGTLVVGTINIFCYGRTGTTIYAQLNGAAPVPSVGANYAPNNSSSFVGIQLAGGNAAVQSRIYEVWVSTTEWSTASVASIMDAAMKNGNPNSPLFPNDANTTLHLIGNAFDGTTWKAPQLAMTTAGTVPYSDAFVPGIALSRAGYGPFSGTDYLSLTGGSNLLDFVGDFSACFRVTLTAADLAAARNIVVNGTFGPAGKGYFVVVESGVASIYTTGPSSTATNAPAQVIASAGPAVICVGRNGNTLYSKANTTATGSAAVVAGWTPDDAVAAAFGTSGSGRTALTGLLHEAWFSLTAASDALFTKITNRALGLLTTNQQPLTVTRTTSQTVSIPAATGQTLWTVPAGAPAINGDGMEVWNTRTNYALQSSTSCVANAVQAPWVANNATCTSDTALAPDGTVSMDTVTSTVNSGRHSQTLTTPSSATFSASTWMAMASGVGSAGVGAYCGAAVAPTSSSCSRSDGGTCAIIAAQPVGDGSVVANVDDLGTTPIRLTLSVTCNAATTAPYIYLVPGKSGVSTGTARFWGAQLEVFPFPGPYCPTTTGTCTTNPTVATLPLPDVSVTDTWCVGATVTPSSGAPWNFDKISYSLIFSAGTAGAANSFYLSYSSANWYYYVYDNAGASRFIINAHGFGANSEPHRVVACNAAGTTSLYVDGTYAVAPIGAGTGLWSSTPASLVLGSGTGTGDTLRAAISDVKVYPNATYQKGM